MVVITMFSYHLLAAWIALFLDKWLGDPPWLPHPVRAIGYIIGKLEKYLNRGGFRKLKGVLAWLIVIAIVFIPAFYIVKTVYDYNIVLGIVIEGLIIFTTIAERSLSQAGVDVAQPLAEGNLVLARERVGWIVGRDTEHLDESEIVRATVETIAENTSDGVTAPLFFAILGGAPFALVYRTVNTCDSMLGYKNDRYIDFGWASARLDDLFNLLPSRITGIVMVLVNGMRSLSILKSSLCILVRDAHKHPSPNSGWCEAATAGLLNIQLGGRNTYKGVVSERARMGDPIENLRMEHIGLSIKIMKRTVVAYMLLFTIGVVCFEMAITWS